MEETPAAQGLRLLRQTFCSLQIDFPICGLVNRVSDGGEMDNEIKRRRYWLKRNLRRQI